MKRCRKCGAVKPLDAFNRDRRSPDGRQSYCRDCSRSAVSEAEATRPNRPSKKASVAARRRAKAEYRRRHPQKHRAHQAVAKAVHRGQIVKPSACERCERPTAAEHLHGHHHDYDKPLEVEWLCRRCHVASHT